jgi:hypothetical protein
MQRVHCYYRQHFMMTAKDRAEILARFVTYAQRHGLELAGIFTDTVDSNSRGLSALRLALAMEDGGLLAVPALVHLAPLGDPQTTVRELAASGIAVVTLPLSFDQGPARSTAADASAQGRSLSQRSGTSLTILGPPAGPLPRAGERTSGDRAAPRSPFHPEDLMRGSRLAPPSSSPSGAPGRGWREPISRSGEMCVAPPVASTAGAQGGATTVLVLEAAPVSPWTPEASTAQVSQSDVLAVAHGAQGRTAAGYRHRLQP